MNVSNAVNTSVNSNNSTTVELLSGKAERSELNKQNVIKQNESDLANQAVIAKNENKANVNEASKAIAITPEQLEKVAQQLQEFMGKMNRSLEFLVDKDSGRDVIKVLDKGTGELVKQYPSEEILTLISKLSNATGNLIDTEI
ncbi:flagellar protein FlaG [Colwellia sp. PAMC 21821]|uniref:flagellar protein FlaG n=1 Tax=Colwellia sp. PAMC 21821 TaxID=1816219 RepID=UPI0009BDEC59|nr:flagellar protein FlaG [Colwellia sp. PAMC 21821]